MKIFRLIGIICLGFWETYYHPVNTKTDVIMLILFWIGMTFFIGGMIDEK